MTPWQWKQRFSVRASTLILFYLVMLIALGYVDMYAFKLPVYLESLLGASGSTLWALLLIDAVFSLAFLVASVVKHRPQLQFLGEFLVSVVAYALLPVY